MAGPALVVGLLLVGWGASKVFARKKDTLWVGIPMTGNTKPDGSKYKVGDTIKIAILDPTQKATVEGQFKLTNDEGSSLNPYYAPVAIAMVRWTGGIKTKTDEKMALGKIASILSYEMSPNPKQKPVIGDKVAFD